VLFFGGGIVGMVTAADLHHAQLRHELLAGAQR
jgi:2-polyprenyl-6-methoxyphenol hydroxylase-like FAD-dependent oxidoreductase